ncbi:MAG TPA: DEAD/DEAH box helicase [Candidatus Saccharimonadales bacterium]|nr:DEAD/DEAH box helicase [Candidatus Saccharimonadales bacterium]
MAKRFSSFKRSNSHSFGSAAPGKRFRGGGSGGFRNYRKQPQPLDINLFIKKAKEQEDEKYTAQNTFENFNLSPQLLKNVQHKGYTSPTPIQDQAIKPIMEGKDLIGIANTGTGKTAAFLLPMIEKVSADKNQKVFIVAPTRELAVQITEELRSFTYGMNIYSSLLIGGAGYNKQIFELRKNPNFVIGTPGRIKDMVEKRILNLSLFQNVILDEVDLMVDIGFIKTVEYFISLLSQNRQSLFFSATVDNKVSRILQNFVKEPVTISVKVQETAEYVDQDVVYVKDRSQKIEQLHDLLNKTGFDKVLVFGRTKWSVENLSKDLEQRGFKVGSIHGNKSQAQRQRVLKEFKQDRIQVLLATDVASRGLDIEDVTHVINYDAPESYDDYVHRIGRTGRANKHGTALTFV